MKINTLIMDISKKDHADFQSEYRQSSNFNAEARDENLELAKDGEVILAHNNPLTESDKKKIADAMDNMRNRIENTDERVARREEE